MNGNLEQSALILGLCLMLSQCGNSHHISLTIKEDDRMTAGYCAGLKTGEAFREILK